MRGEVHHPEGGRRGGAARIRGIRGEGRAGRGTAVEVLPSVRRRTERGGTGIVAGGTAGACVGRMDGRAEHAVRRCAGRGVMGCEAGETVVSCVERRRGRGKSRLAVGRRGLMGRGCNDIIQVLGCHDIIQVLGGARRGGGSAWHFDRRRVGRGAAAMRGEVAPGRAVHTVGGGAPDGVWWSSAGRGRPESDCMVSKFLGGGGTSVVGEIRRRAGRDAAAMRGEVAAGLAVQTVGGGAPDGVW